MTGRPALVIFDCDGVLVDSEPIALRVLLETLSASGLDLDTDAALDCFLGRSLASTRAILAEDFGFALSDDALAAMRRRLYAAFRAEITAISGVAAILAALRLPFCAASSSLPERIELSLRVAGLWTAFEGRVFSATQVARGKPAPDLFFYAAGCMGYAPDDCLVVEDGPAGIRAAKAAGMAVGAFIGGSHARGAQHRAAVAALEPDEMIDDMRAGDDGPGPAAAARAARAARGGRTCVQSAADAALPVLEPRAADAVLLGTAMVAAVTAGLHPDLGAAGRAMDQGRHARRPDPAAGPRMARDWRAYSALRHGRDEVAALER